MPFDRKFPLKLVAYVTTDMLELSKRTR